MFNDEMLREIGQVSKEFRESKGITIGEIADEMHKHMSSVYRFEAGEVQMPLEYMMVYGTKDQEGNYNAKVKEWYERGGLLHG